MEHAQPSRCERKGAGERGDGEGGKVEQKYPTKHVCSSPRSDTESLLAQLGFGSADVSVKLAKRMPTFGNGLTPSVTRFQPM